jgi:predicted enzyme related to lactoylglutathione lyase
MRRTMFRLLAVAVLATFAVVALRDRLSAAGDATSDAAFARTTIDLGLVVSDADRTVKFYTEAIGMKKVGGFSVAGSFASDGGLTDGAGLDITVLALGDDASATKLKVMQVKGTKHPAKKTDNQFIHSQNGFRYITISIQDTAATVARLEKAGVKPIAKTPAEIPEHIAKDMWLTIVRDPDGNFVELVGPKK